MTGHKEKPNSVPASFLGFLTELSSSRKNIILAEKLGSFCRNESLRENVARNYKRKIK